MLFAWLAPHLEMRSALWLQVKKSYEAKRAKRKAQGRGSRAWRLARLPMESAEGAEKTGAAGRKAAERDTADMESFLRVWCDPLAVQIEQHMMRNAKKQAPLAARLLSGTPPTWSLSCRCVLRCAFGSSRVLQECQIPIPCRNMGRLPHWNNGVVL